MNHQASQQYYTLHCAGQRLCVLAEEVHYMGSLNELSKLAGISGLAFNGTLYPVYGLQDGLRPAMGLQAEDTHCLVLKSLRDESPVGIALACHSVLKIRGEAPPYILPSFMLPAYALVTGLLKHEGQWLHIISVGQIIDFLENVGFSNEQQSNADRLAG